MDREGTIGTPTVEDAIALAELLSSHGLRILSIEGNEIRFSGPNYLVQGVLMEFLKSGALLLSKTVDE